MAEVLSGCGREREGKVERGGEGKEVSKEYGVLDVHVVEVHEHW